MPAPTFLPGDSVVVGPRPALHGHDLGDPAGWVDQRVAGRPASVLEPADDAGDVLVLVKFPDGDTLAQYVGAEHLAHRFEVGDRVRVIDASGDGRYDGAQVGDVGTVTDVVSYEGSLDARPTIYVDLDNGRNTGMFAYRFEPAREPAPEQRPGHDAFDYEEDAPIGSDEPLRVGDRVRVVNATLTDLRVGSTGTVSGHGESRTVRVEWDAPDAEQHAGGWSHYRFERIFDDVKDPDDAARAMLSAAEAIRGTDSAVEIGGFRIVDAEVWLRDQQPTTAAPEPEPLAEWERELLGLDDEAREIVAAALLLHGTIDRHASAKAVVRALREKGLLR